LSDSQGEDVAALLATFRGQYRRIWLARSVPDSQAAALLRRSTFLAQDWGFRSPLTFLRLELFQIDPPAVDRLPASGVQPADATFGDGISLRGYEVGQPFEPGRSVPITLYWQADQHLERRYKYILRWVVRDADGTERVLATTEKEPYDELLPTTGWKPGAMIREYTSLLSPADETLGASYLTLQMYDAKTLRKLPLQTAMAAPAVTEDDTLILPLAR
jgi:hypothetical protein